MAFMKPSLIFLAFFSCLLYALHVEGNPKCSNSSPEVEDYAAVFEDSEDSPEADSESLADPLELDPSLRQKNSQFAQIKEKLELDPEKFKGLQIIVLNVLTKLIRHDLKALAQLHQKVQKLGLTEGVVNSSATNTSVTDSSTMNSSVSDSSAINSSVTYSPSSTPGDNSNLSGKTSLHLMDEYDNTIIDPIPTEECKVTKVTVLFCIIEIHHIGTLPHNLLVQYDEEYLASLLCPCPKPDVGLHCPPNTRDVLINRIDSRCKK